MLNQLHECRANSHHSQDKLTQRVPLAIDHEIPENNAVNPAPNPYVDCNMDVPNLMSVWKPSRFFYNITKFQAFL
jgi:hypothetical protein